MTHFWSLLRSWKRLALFIKLWVFSPTHQLRLSQKKALFLAKVLPRYSFSVGLHLFVLAHLGNPLGILFIFWICCTSPFSTTLLLTSFFIALALTVSRLLSEVPEAYLAYLLLVNCEEEPKL